MGWINVSNQDSTQQKNIYRPAPPRLVQVKRIVDITPGMRSITFTSDDLDNYPSHTGGAHLKIFLPVEGQTKPTIPTLTDKGPSWPENQPRAIVRTYSVRAIRPELKELDIEFAVHEDAGPAINFALNAKVGDYIGITNPGGPDPLLAPASHYYMAADPSSLPALMALIETMSPEVQGKAVIRIENESDRQIIDAPQGLEIVWLVGSVETQTQPLIDEFISWSLPKEDVAFWIAGEDKIIRALRRYIRRDKGYERGQIYAIPYWRFGFNEEGYHAERHHVMDNEDVS